MDSKTVKFLVWDWEADELIEMYMEEEDYKAMVEAEEQQKKEEEERQKRLDEEYYATLRYFRDD